MEPSQGIAHNIAAIRERIAAAAARAGRSPDEITLIAVTKTHSARRVDLALAAGVTDCGENRVQEADEKIELLREARARWHLIGHLQRNKAKRAAALFDMIHSLDSVKLAEALNRHVEENSLLGQRRLPVLLQVNVSGEATKEGFDLIGGVTNQTALVSLVEAARQIVALPQLDVQGLMTVAPYSDDPEDARPVFRALRELRDELARQIPQAAWQHLSMGMTGDFEVAIEEGATLVRVGRAIFGERG
ncbi:MAG: YggS family pyridoxal phosphate-dependent enzyme [Chloroflexi bacterium]|nr:YggS family pyridoxal phosphate-dependent enzyme [Chloroflexota bacterium]